MKKRRRRLQQKGAGGALKRVVIKEEHEEDEDDEDKDDEDEGRTTPRPSTITRRTVFRCFCVGPVLRTKPVIPCHSVRLAAALVATAHPEEEEHAQPLQTAPKRRI